uniref:Uncharacterized protein n=1 Tax=Onchocerca volvulus TaxID=6282 RepID=A0A8R1Y5Q7_ONCVO
MDDILLIIILCILITITYSDYQRNLAQEKEEQNKKLHSQSQQVENTHSKPSKKKRRKKISSIRRQVLEFNTITIPIRTISLSSSIDNPNNVIPSTPLPFTPMALQS